MTLMIDQVSFPHAPPSSRYINPDHKDPMNQGVDGTNMGPHPTFVDYAIKPEVRSLIRQADKNSLLTVSFFIGNSNIFKEPISIKKFKRFFTHLNKTLGFITGSSSVTASYPEYKRASLLDILQSSEWDPKNSHQVLILSRILGNIYHLDQIFPFGKSSLRLPSTLCVVVHPHTHPA